MTMTPERLAELDAVMANTTKREWSADGLRDNRIVWSGPDTRVCFMAIYPKAHADSLAIVALHNAYPELKALIDAQAATIARLEAELEKTTHPHFWCDVDDNENGCDDITSILENHEIGEVVEVLCARNLPNQWAVGYVTESGRFRGQTFATEAEAVAFAAERAALDDAGAA